VCRETHEEPEEGLLRELEGRNRAELEKLEEAMTDAVENLGDVEQRDALMNKAEYLSAIGDKEGAESGLRKAFDKTVPLGQRLDILFHQIRLGFFFMNHDVVTRNLQKAKSLMEEGGDWDRKNRLKVYEGLHSLTTRDFKVAAVNFFETMATFTCSEVMEYQSFVKYAVFACMVAMDRSFIKEKILEGAEILEVLHTNPELNAFVRSFYDCHYGDFFKVLIWVEEELQSDRYLSSHCHFIIRELRIKAYAQLLESYRSLSLTAMADTFGVTDAFIDRELSRFIAMGRLNCRIDKVGGVVETNRPDSKNFLYQSTIKQGDLLLNRLQKLSRIINL
jgi:26S proteasome regulatory subunit N7